MTTKRRTQFAGFVKIEAPLAETEKTNLNL